MHDKKHAMKLDPKRTKLMRLLAQLSQRARQVLSQEEFVLYMRVASDSFDAGTAVPQSPEEDAMEQKLLADPQASALIEKIERLGNEIEQQ